MSARGSLLRNVSVASSVARPSGVSCRMTFARFAIRLSAQSSIIVA